MLLQLSVRRILFLVRLIANRPRIFRMSLIFLTDGSIGAEIVNMTNDLIAYLQQVRTQSTFHRFALFLPLLAVRIFKAMVVAPFIIGMSRWKAY